MDRSPGTCVFFRPTPDTRIDVNYGPPSLRAASAASGMKLLRHTDHSNEQIACECGFGDRYSFTRIFMKHRQTTPAAFRKQARAYYGAEGFWRLSHGS